MERFKWLWQVYQDGGLPADLESALEVHGNHREVFHCNKAYLVISVLGKYDHFRVKLFEAWRATQKLATQRSKSQVSKSQVHGPKEALQVVHAALRVIDRDVSDETRELWNSHVGGLTYVSGYLPFLLRLGALRKSGSLRLGCGPIRYGLCRPTDPKVLLRIEHLTKASERLSQLLEVPPETGKMYSLKQQLLLEAPTWCGMSRIL